LTKTAWAALALGLVASAGASAVTLTDVRIGVHRDHTRIVLETDAKAPYIVDAGDKEIIVHVDAAATAEAVTAKSPHLIWAKVEPTAIGADVRLSLKQPADVKAMVLTGPDRIVLDLYPRKGGAEPLPAPELIPEEEPAVTAEVAPPVPTPALEEPGLPAEPEAEPEQIAAAEEVVEPTAEGEPETPPALEEEPAPESPETEEPPATPEGEAEELAAEPEAAAEPAPPTTPLAPAPSRSPFRSPVLLAAAAALLLFVFLFLRRRLRGAETARLPEWRPSEEAPVLPEDGAVSEVFPRTGGESVFDVEPESLAEPFKEEEAPPALRRARPEAEDETERRIAHLERRIEELVDARDRLERQLAAQTEELRVQRAAIARTQRVLRTVAPRSEDDSSGEPVRG
jgi:hypothetical protein